MFLLYFYQKNTALVSTEESIQNIKKNHTQTFEW